MMLLFWPAISTLGTWHAGEFLVVGAILVCWLVIGLLVSGFSRSWYPFGVSFVCVWIATASLAIMLVMQQQGG